MHTTRPRTLVTRHQQLPRTFYCRPTVTVARQLLGNVLVRRSGRQLLGGRIIEVEAYLGHEDPASHAFRGRTARNDVMFWEGGHLYVYFTYGKHFCANVVTGREGTGSAVLIRALEPLQGIHSMASNRQRPVSDLGALCSGPAKLCQALGITRNENGTDLCGSTVWIEKGEDLPRTTDIETTTRIGISKGKEAKLRFFIRKRASLSGPGIRHNRE